MLSCCSCQPNGDATDTTYFTNIKLPAAVFVISAIALAACILAAHYPTARVVLICLTGGVALLSFVAICIALVKSCSAKPK